MPWGGIVAAPQYIILAAQHDVPWNSADAAGSGKHQMMYYAYQAYADAMTPFQALANATADLMEHSWPGFPGTEWQRRFAAGCTV